MDFPAGTMVEYHSASMNQWIPARVIQAGRAHGTVDLDCKEGVLLDRIRRPGPPKTVAPTCPNMQAKPPATSFGPLNLRVGDYCFYKSGTHGWISATVQSFRQQDNTYDLDVKQQVSVEKVRPIEEHMVVEYHSTSTNQWIPAKVLRKGHTTGHYDLDCKQDVHISRLRIPSGGGGGMPFIPETQPQGLHHGMSPAGSIRSSHDGTIFPGGPHAGHVSSRDGGYLKAPYFDEPRYPSMDSYSREDSGSYASHSGILKQHHDEAVPNPKLQQLRQAIQNEDPIQLRKRLESKTALNHLGDEMDHAQHALWVMEARPEALKDLKRACARNNIDDLQAALEAAAVVGVSEEELEAASRRLFALQSKMWRYDAGDGRHMDLRKEPKVDGPRVRQRLNAGDVFEVAEERKGHDGITYLRLADGRGWAFDHKPGVGSMCVKQYAEEETRRAQMGNQPISLTIADLRSQHNQAMKQSRGASHHLSSISEEDSPGPYVILERTAVTPALGLCSEEDIISTLDAGTVVDVLEVSQRPELKRIRGRISHPRGWISLVDTKNGRRWAEKQSY